MVKRRIELRSDSLYLCCSVFTFVAAASSRVPTNFFVRYGFCNTVKAVFVSSLFGRTLQKKERKKIPVAGVLPEISWRVVGSIALLDGRVGLFRLCSSRFHIFLVVSL